MRFTHYLYIASFALLAACSSDDQTETLASIADNGAILLSAGIVEGGQELVTRAGAEDNHARHLTLTSDTKLALQVSGTWTNHNPSSVIKATTATVGAVTATDSKHNNVSCSPVLYWDDYGTADPANSTTGRTEGLTIYGAAINGKATAPVTAPTSEGWAIAWTLNADQTATDNTPADKDLLISNNVKAGTGDGTYKFANRESGKLLEFTHALSKITVNLKAGDGFTNNTFASTPIVTLTSATSTEWAYTAGTVDVTSGSISNLGTLSSITMNQLATPTTNYTVTKEALVMPGSQFKTHNDTIIKINADGNIYYVSAAKIRKAIDPSNYTNGTAFPTVAGKNYIINVTVNKTDIVVTATVTNWTDVTAAEVSPKIKVDAAWGSTGSATSNSFKFYRSTSLNTGYSGDAVVSKSSDTWTMSPTLYWPTHNTHYQFRGVVPLSTTASPSTPVDPTVTTKTDNSTEYQVIAVNNVAYQQGYFPSDLQIGRPEIDATAYCTNTESGHTQTLLYSGGICATEGAINLNFRYMMSQVEVNLSTTDGSLHDNVTLTNAKVEIVNVYNQGYIKLGDREVILGTSTGTYELGNYSLNTTTNVANYKSAIIPQTLTYTEAQATTNVRFKITITNADHTTDIYYADINPILLSGSTTEKVAPNGKWESGVHYVYNLKLAKTKVNVTATLAEWTTVNAAQEVWF